MDLMKIFLHGWKAFLFVILGGIVAVIIGALNAALKFIPDGAINVVIWDWLIKPAIVGIIAAITNWWAHRK